MLLWYGRQIPNRYQLPDAAFRSWDHQICPLPQTKGSRFFNGKAAFIAAAASPFPLEFISYLGSKN
jgi:hypothetical protein